MIDMLRGTLETLEANSVTLFCAGVGYKVRISGYTFSYMEQAWKRHVREEVTLYIHHSMRENAWELFGFSRGKERELFRLLTSVQGVGGSAALALLSDMEPDEIRDCILSGDVARIKEVKGVGDIIAKRLVNELARRI